MAHFKLQKLTSTHQTQHVKTSMPRYFPLNADDQPSSAARKLFGRRRPLHDLFGGGRFADIVLWRDKRLSGSILLGLTLIWLLFEVVEYNFLTLVCHIAITAMLLVFIWSNGAAILNLPPPKIPEVILSEKFFREVALTFHAELSHFMFILHDIARGKDLKSFLMMIASLWILSVIGSCCSSVNLIYFALVCILTLPALYERYEREVDHLASKGSQDLKKLYKKFDSQVLDKIPRGPVKEKKFQ